MSGKLMAPLATSLALFFGCADRVDRFINLDNMKKYPIERPLVVGVNGLATKTVEYLVGRVSCSYHYPYVVSDVGNWKDNIDEIEAANAQRRKIVVIASSAGCFDAEMLAKECDTRGISVERLIYVNPFYTGLLFSKPDIPKNVKNLDVYFSNPQEADPMFWANGDIEKFDRNDERIRKIQEINSTHAGFLFDNDVIEGVVEAVCSATRD